MEIPKSIRINWRERARKEDVFERVQKGEVFKTVKRRRTQFIGLAL